MEPEALYNKLSSRVKELLELKPIDAADNEREIYLFADFTSDTIQSGDDEDPEFRIEGGSVSTRNSVKSLFSQASMSVRWLPDGTHDGYYAQSNVVLSFQPTRQMFLASDHCPGAMFIIGVRGGYKIRVKDVRLGACEDRRARGSHMRFPTEPGGKAEWDIQTDNHDLRDIRPSFHETFGSNKALLVLKSIKVSTAAILCEEITHILDGTRGSSTEQSHAFSLTSREKQAMDSARKQLHARDKETDLFALQSESTTFRLLKSSLACHSPAFATCFQNVQSQEVQNNCYVINSSTPEAVENLIVYCEHFLVPEIDIHALELVKLAHVYQMESLLKLCELYLMDEVARFAASKLEELPGKFPKFLDICTVASLYELPLLLVLLHFLITVIDEKIVHFSEFAQWRKFLFDTPNFTTRRIDAIAKIKAVQT